MGRREFITGLGVRRPGPLRRSPAKRSTEIGILWPARDTSAARMESFRQALRQLGFVEGKNVAIELRYARGGLQQLPELAAELVRMKADVLLTFGDLTPKIAQEATKTRDGRAWPMNRAVVISITSLLALATMAAMADRAVALSMEQAMAQCKEQVSPVVRPAFGKR